MIKSKKRGKNRDYDVRYKKHYNYKMIIGQCCTELNGPICFFFFFNFRNITEYPRGHGWLPSKLRIIKRNLPSRKFDINLFKRDWKGDVRSSI